MESYSHHQGIRAHPTNLPQHVAIIMDGNGRWASMRNWSRTQGHRKGVEVARDIIFACQEKNIKMLTLFAFGVENWKRPTKEVRNLFRIFFLVLRKEINRLHERNIKLRIIGDRQHFNVFLLKAIQDAEKLTEYNTDLVLNVAVNYSGRWDLLQAIKKICLSVQNQALTLAEISESMISQTLSLQGALEPDLFIRTGGVQRISNFILWELAYTELFFTPTLWPDFTLAEFNVALNNYSLRERRFGLTAEQLG